MYGTIARITVDPSKREALKTLADNMAEAPGQAARYVFQMDANPDELFLVAIFESKEAYWANAQSAGQHERYMQLRALLTEDPQWHDGEVISMA